VEQATVSRSDRVNAVSLRHENGRQTVIAWARTANPVTIRVLATGNKALILDQYGYITEVRPVDGLYEMMLPGATCNSVDGCPVGGAVSLIIQPDGVHLVEEITSAGTVPLVLERENLEE
jgi:hypothetical protein